MQNLKRFIKSLYTGIIFKKAYPNKFEIIRQHPKIKNNIKTVLVLGLEIIKLMFNANKIKKINSKIRI
jgi:hypothetical protein